MKKSTKRLATVIGAAAVAVAGATVAATVTLVKAAVHRDGVKVPLRLQSKVTGGMLDDPNLKYIFKASEKAKLLETETVKITSRDNLTLNGHLYMCKNPKRIIVAMHGWRSNWQNDFGCSVEFLHNEQSVVLFPDQRGQNDSEGDYIGFGVLERNDCVDWVKFVVERFGTDLPIYLLGVSMGATTVLMASGAKLPDCVKGIIADCGFTSPHDIWKHVIENNLKIREKVAYPIANAIIKKRAQYDGDEYSTLEALAKNEKPVLFIHGSSDTFVPIDMTFKNYLACASPKEFFIVPGAGHGMSYVVDTKGYEKAVRGFFHKCENGFDDI